MGGCLAGLGDRGFDWRMGFGLGDGGFGLEGGRGVCDEGSV